MNIMIYISYILTIGIKFVNSPSYYIIEYLENNLSANKKDILKYLDTKNMIEDRFIILQNENLIKINNNTLELTNSGKIFCSIFIKIKNFFKIKNEG